MKKLVSTLILCLGLLGTLTAQNIWKPIAMEGEFLGVSANGDIFCNWGYSGVYRSSDEGVTWDSVYNLSYVMSSSFMINDHDRIFVFNENSHKLCYSDDNGDTWQEQTSGISTNWVDGMYSLSNDTILMANHDKVFWTLNGGESWNETSIDFIGDALFGSIIADHAGNAYVCCYSWTYPVEQVGIYTATLDDMSHWTLKSSGGARDMAFDSQGNILATNLGSAYYVNGVYYVGADRFALTDDDVIFAMKRVDYDNEALFYSTDRGQTYTRCSENILSTTTAPDSDLGLYKGRDNHLYCHADVWEPEFERSNYKSVSTINSILYGFASPSAEWYFNVYNPWSQHPQYTRFYVEGDTVIQGHSCSIIRQNFVETGSGHEYGEFVYEEDNKVYWFNPTTNNFTTLYDFEAEAGDTWYCEVGDCSCLVTVDSIGSVTWDGHAYRTQWVRFSENYNSESHGKIIEGIGFEKGLFPSTWTCNGGIVCDASEIEYLRCYVEDGEILYHEGDYDCDWSYVNTNCWDGTYAEAYAGGDGSEGDPYQIANARQLALLAHETNTGIGGDAYYKLTSNINLGSCDSFWFTWTSIGVPESNGTPHYFTGHFDGNGMCVLNLYQRQNDTFKGLFGCTDGAVIKDVRIVDCEIGNESEYAGGLVAYAGRTTIMGCMIENSVVQSDAGEAGGLVGYMGTPYQMTEANDADICVITSCQTTSSVQVIGHMAGGIVAKSNTNLPLTHCSISNCINAASTQSTADLQEGGAAAGGVGCWMICTDISNCVNLGNSSAAMIAGGIAGTFSRGHMSDCYNYGSSYSNYIAGGVIGSLNTMALLEITTERFIFRNCHNYGDAVVERDGNLGMCGGVIGHFVGGNHQRFCIVDCSNHGNVTCHGEHAGGVLGWHRGHTDMEILNVYNTGDVSALTSAGGIVGFHESVFTIRNAYNAGEIHCENPTLEGAIIGSINNNNLSYDTISHCYWKYDMVGVGSALQATLPHSCAFNPTTHYGEWALDSIQFGHDLVEALNTGAQEIDSLYPEIGPVSRWMKDEETTNGGYPIFGTNGNLQYSLVGSEWYYEILNENGNITYQYLQHTNDTTIKDEENVHILVRINTLYDKGQHVEKTQEYICERNNKVYWWNKELEEFTVLYDFGAKEGDEWEIKVGLESLVMHVDEVDEYEFEGKPMKILRVSDAGDVFSGTIVCGIGHLTSFFPERLMQNSKEYRVKGIRCFWRNGELVLKYGEKDCDEIYEEHHYDVDEPLATDGFNVYPNPTNGIIVVETVSTPSLQGQTEYRISNMLGQTLLTGRIDNNTQQIDVNALPEGMYFINVNNQTIKFVKR